MFEIKLEFEIIKLTGLDINLALASGSLFIRYYICAGDGKRIVINTQEIPCTSTLSWNEALSLRCKIDDDSVKDAILAHNVIFELRWRTSSKTVFGRNAKSKIMGRADVAWGSKSELNEMSDERSISFVTTKSVNQDVKPPKLVLRMGMKIMGSSPTKKDGTGGNKCRCERCRSAINEEDLFLAAITLNSC